MTDWKPDENEVETIAKATHESYRHHVWSWDKLDGRSKHVARKDIRFIMDRLVKRGWFPGGTYEKGQRKILERVARILEDVKENDYGPEDVLNELRIMVEEGPRYGS